MFDGRRYWELILVPCYLEAVECPCMCRPVLLETALSIRLLANVEGDVPILDHVSDLALHRDGEEDAEVDQENGPEDRYVKEPEQCASKRNHNRPCCRVPKLELW